MNIVYLEIENLSKSFKGNLVLNNISLGIKKHSFVTLLGPSGCGKSTLLRCIAGLEKVDSGSIYLDKKYLNNMKPAKRNIGMIFQEYSLFPTKNVFDNIAFGMKIRKFDKNIIKQRVREILELIDLKGYDEKYPAQLSGGQKQRVALARSLIIEPKIILFDEPLSAIDAKLRKDLQVKIKEIHHRLGMTSIFVTHDQEEAMLLSDIIFLMNNGNIEQSGSPRELYYNPKNLFVASFIGDHNIIKADKMKSIFDIEINKDYFVISPESISTYEAFNNEIRFKAKIKDIMFLGDFLRILIEYKGIVLKCNLSDYQLNNFKIDDVMDFRINLDRCVSVDK